MIYLAAIMLSFSVPTNETIEVHIQRNIGESGRQEVGCDLTDAIGTPIACSSRFPSPSIEVISYTSESFDYTLTIGAEFDPTSVRVEIYVIPETHLDADGYYMVKTTPGYVYQVEDTSDLSRWRDEGREFRASGSDQEWIATDTGITNPSRFKPRKMYRVRIIR